MLTYDSEQPLVPAPVLPAPTASPNSILAGPLGLRAGWAILLFFTLSTLIGSILFLGLFKASGQYDAFQRDSERAREASARAKAAHVRVDPDPIELSVALPTEMAELGAVVLAGLALSFLDGRRFAVYGLPLRHLRAVVPGALCGLAALTLLVALLRGFGLLVFDSRLLHGAAALRYGLSWLFLFAIVGTFEEFLFRGYIQFTLTRGLLGLGRRLSPESAQRAAFWMAAVLLSLLFFLTHISNPGETRAGLAGVFLAGILFSYALWRTGSLWWGIGFHMTWDWAQSFLYGVPDSGTLSVGRLFATHPAGNPLLSGGVDGPEASLLLLPVLALVFVVLRLHPPTEQPRLEPDSLPPFLYTPAPRRIA